MLPFWFFSWSFCGCVYGLFSFFVIIIVPLLLASFRRIIIRGLIAKFPRRLPCLLLLTNFLFDFIIILLGLTLAPTVGGWRAPDVGVRVVRWRESTLADAPLSSPALMASNDHVSCYYTHSDYLSKRNIARALVNRLLLILFRNFGLIRLSDNFLDMLLNFLSLRTYARAGARIKPTGPLANRKKLLVRKNLEQKANVPNHIPDFVVRPPSGTWQECAHRLKLIGHRYGAPYVFATLKTWLDTRQLTGFKVKFSKDPRDGPGLLTTGLFNQALEVLSEEGGHHLRLCFKLAAEMRRRSVPVDGMSMSCLLRTLCHGKALPADHAQLFERVLSYWRPRSIEDDGYVFNGVCAYHGRTDVAKLLELCPPATLPNRTDPAITATIILEALARSNQPQLALPYHDALSGMRNAGKDAKYDRALLMCLSAVWHERTDEKPPSQSPVSKDRLFHLLEDTVRHDLTTETKALISLQLMLYRKLGKHDKAISVYDSRVRPFWTKGNLDHRIIALHLRSLTKLGKRDDGWREFDFLRQQFNYRPDDAGLVSLLEACDQDAVKVDSLMNGYVFNQQQRPVDKRLIDVYYRIVKEQFSRDKTERLARLAKWARTSSPATWQQCLQENQELRQYY
jgi:hypothetical protein